MFALQLEGGGAVNPDPKRPLTPGLNMMGKRQAEAPELGPLFYSSDKDESATHLQSSLFLQGAPKDPVVCKLCAS